MPIRLLSKQVVWYHDWFKCKLCIKTCSTSAEGSGKNGVIRKMSDMRFDTLIRLSKQCALLESQIANNDDFKITLPPTQ